MSNLNTKSNFCSNLNSKTKITRKSESKSILIVHFLLLNIFLLGGCSTLKSMLGMKTEAAPAPKYIPKDLNGDPLVRFSENTNVPHTEQRNYRKMTRQKMEAESDLGSNAGSMWVMEGQGAYLFAQNKSRREGDMLKISIDSSAQQQIDTKVSVIKKLLKQLEDQEQLRQQQLMPENPATTPGTLADGANPETRAPANVTEKKEKDEPVKIDMVPTRVVERISDGSYRLKGAQPFMIGKREYKVIVTGIIRPEDYNDEGVSSSKLLDPQYDVVSLRRKE